MRRTDAPQPAPPWTPEQLRRALVVTALLGASLMYCLGIGSLALKRQLLAVPHPTSTPVPTADWATSTPLTDILLPDQTLEPTPTQGTLVFPTPRPTSSPTPSPTPPVTQTVSGTPPTPTSTPTVTARPSQTATSTPTATQTPSETPSSTPSATPSPTETPTAEVLFQSTSTPIPSATETLTASPTSQAPAGAPPLLAVQACSAGRVTHNQ